MGMRPLAISVLNCQIVIPMNFAAGRRIKEERLVCARRVAHLVPSAFWIDPAFPRDSGQASSSDFLKRNAGAAGERSGFPGFHTGM
jgi:hypothetical protein